MLKDMRHINMDLVRVTEAAAIAASRWVGSGDKLSADQAATDAMRDRLNNIDFSAEILIGEGKKDESYGLFQGERVGRGGLAKHWTSKDGSDPPENRDDWESFNSDFTIAVDPIDGTTPTVNSGPEAVSVLAIAEKQAMYTTDEHYMLKLAYGPKIADKITMLVTSDIKDIAQTAAAALKKDVSKLMVCVLNRPRHDCIVEPLRELGVRIQLIQDCDVSGAIATCLPNSGIDLYFGIGGAPEAVITAAAMKCLGGEFQAQHSGKEYKPQKHGEILTQNDLINSECAFVATGITNGSILRGVEWQGNSPKTHSVFMRSQSRTIRWLDVQHGN